MDRAKSWVLPQAKTEETLNHEQRHFDLNEVYRRLLELSLGKFLGIEVSGATREEAEGKLKTMLNAVFERVIARCQEIQNRYDRETDHGRNLQKQREWDRWISEWLSDLFLAPKP
jgi:predicted secreted Zn-dependent protease